VIKKWPFTYQKVKKRPILVKLFDNNLTTSAARLKQILRDYRPNSNGHTVNQGEGMGKITVV
jgi:truncated hemoglobin YjbI